MSAIHEQIAILETALQRIRDGDSSDLSHMPALLQEIRHQADDLYRRQRELGSLYEVGQELASILNLDRLLGSILDRAIVLVGAERGFLVLCREDEAEGAFDVPVARQFDQAQVDSDQIEISRGLIRRVLATREPVVTTNAQEDPRFQTSHSVITYQIRSVLAAPMIAKEKLIGAIYVDTRLGSRLFDESDLALLTAMANQAAVAIELAHLYEDLRARNLELSNALQELRETQDELIQAERMSLVGRTAASIIHDLKIPMTTIKGYAALLGRSDLSSERRQRFSSLITDAVDRFVAMTQEILDYARGGGKLQPQEQSLTAFLTDFCDFVQPEFDAKGLHLVRQFRFQGKLWFDEPRLRRALFNIASNASDALSPGGTLTISTSATSDSVEIHFVDTGPGVPEQIRDSLFEPFVTHGKPAGTGLGLAIAKKTIEDHGGSARLEATSGKGATFVVRLPRSYLGPGAEPATAESAQLSR
jgi:signal transduction histidine kinase